MITTNANQKVKQEPQVSTFDFVPNFRSINDFQFG